MLLVLVAGSNGIPECPAGTLVNNEGVCYYETEHCKPDMYGNTYCTPEYDPLNILFSTPLAILVVVAIPCVIITGVALTMVIIRKKPST